MECGTVIIGTSQLRTLTLINPTSSDLHFRLKAQDSIDGQPTSTTSCGMQYSAPAPTGWFVLRPRLYLNSKLFSLSILLVICYLLCLLVQSSWLHLKECSLLTSKQTLDWLWDHRSVSTIQLLLPINCSPANVSFKNSSNHGNTCTFMCANDII